MGVKEMVNVQKTTLNYYLKNREFRLSANMRPSDVQKISPTIRESLFPHKML